MTSLLRASGTARPGVKRFPPLNESSTKKAKNSLPKRSHRLSAPVIASLRQGFNAPKLAELERLFNKLPELDEKSRQEIAYFADRLVNKMLHPPMESLRDESKNGSPKGLLTALKRLFQLEG